MSGSILERLECPRCKESLALAQVRSRTARIEFGLLECPCSTYPIVGGVAVLKRGGLTAAAVARIRAGDNEGACAVLLGGSAIHGGALRRRSVDALRALAASELLGGPDRLVPRVAEVTVGSSRTAQWPTFQAGLEALVEPARFREYLLYRPFCQSFWSLHAVLPLLDRAAGWILDLGGGAGHAARLLSTSLGRSVCNVDTDVRLLYLAAQFMHPTEPAIAVERGRDLPFRSDAFDTAVNLDGLHYFEHKYAAGRELDRVTDDRGAILLLHQHTQALHPHHGIPVAPDTYRECVPRGEVLLSEDQLLAAFLEANDDFAVEPEETVQGDASLLFGVDRTTVPKADNALFDPGRTLAENPLYRKSGGRLERRPTSAGFRSEFAFSFDRTRPEYDLDRIGYRELVERGVLARLPPNYADRQARVDIDRLVSFECPGENLI